MFPTAGTTVRIDYVDFYATIADKAPVIEQLEVFNYCDLSLAKERKPDKALFITPGSFPSNLFFTMEVEADTAKLLAWFQYTKRSPHGRIIHKLP